jgi:predicted ArsR family transcriptional regulator
MSTPTNPASTPPSPAAGSGLRRGRTKDALAFIDRVRVASHLEVAHYLGISAWKASAVCNRLHKLGLVSREQRGGRGRNALPSVWHTKTNI